MPGVEITGENMNSAQRLQLIELQDPLTFDPAGRVWPMTCLSGGFLQPEEAWATMRAAGYNEDVWHAMTKSHRVWSGVVEWDYIQTEPLMRMLAGEPTSETADGVETLTWELPTEGPRGVIPFAIEYGRSSDCERCLYGLLVSLSMEKSRDGEKVTGNVTFICRKPIATGVAMTGASAATAPVFTLVFTSVPAVQEFRLKTNDGDDDYAMITPSTSNADIKAAIESLDGYAGKTVTVTGSLTGSTDKSGTLTITFGQTGQVPSLLVKQSESQSFTVTGGDGDADYSIAGCTAFSLGATAADIQTAIRATGGDNANVVVTGTTTAPIP